MSVVPAQQKNADFLVIYKAYSQSVVPTQFSSVKNMLICKPCSVQFSCKFRKTLIVLPLTNPTVVPTQQENNDFLDFLATYNPTVSQLFPRSSFQSKPCEFANLVQFSSVVNLETQAACFSCYRAAEER